MSEPTRARAVLSTEDFKLIREAVLFYLRAHRALPDSPSLVFASMNLGVVALGAVAGVALFRERLGRINAAGLLLALVAIALLALG